MQMILEKHLPLVKTSKIHFRLDFRLTVFVLFTLFVINLLFYRVLLYYLFLLILFSRNIFHFCHYLILNWQFPRLSWGFSILCLPVNAFNLLIWIRNDSCVTSACRVSAAVTSSNIEAVGRKSGFKQECRSEPPFGKLNPAKKGLSEGTSIVHYPPARSAGVTQPLSLEPDQRSAVDAQSPAVMKMAAA